MCSLYLIEGWCWFRRFLEVFIRLSKVKHGNVIIKSGVALRKTLFPEAIPLWLTDGCFLFPLNRKSYLVLIKPAGGKTYSIYREWIKTGTPLSKTQYNTNL